MAFPPESVGAVHENFTRVVASAGEVAVSTAVGAPGTVDATI